VRGPERVYLAKRLGARPARGFPRGRYWTIHGSPGCARARPLRVGEGQRKPMNTYIFSNGHETIEHGSLMLDPDVAERLTARGPLTIRERFADGRERVILDAGKPPTPNGAPAPTSDAIPPADAPTPIVAKVASVDVAPAPTTEQSSARPVSPVSTWTNTVHDADAAKRINAQQDALRAAGVDVNASEQFYATGTRMASEGYANQDARKAEHNALMFVRHAADALRAAVESEGRTDVTMTARDLVRDLTVNGSIAIRGHKLGEQAIRGIFSRLGAPGVGYALGLRDRIAESVSTEKGAEAHDKAAREKGEAVDTAIVQARRAANTAERQADLRQIAEVLAFECERSPETTLRLRMRSALRDVYAVVAPSYGEADAPTVLGSVVAELPSDARGTYTYDPVTTAWELRAHVWTSTPVAEQAVGEPFTGYASFRSRDNGTSRLRGGGGVTLLRCLNASTYEAVARELSRIHRGDMTRGLDVLVKHARLAIDALCEAWGTARQAEIAIPIGVPIDVAIPGFWLDMLKRDKPLVGVLRGRKEERAQALTAAYFSERRDANRVVRADLAQAWTRHIQGEDALTRRDAESAIGSWLASGRVPRYEAPEAK